MPDISPVEEILEPVITENGKKWLVIKEKQVIATDRSPKEILENPVPPETIKVFELRDDCLWQCAKC